jgi:coenzyme PQQ precursor peptide PqqA
MTPRSSTLRTSDTAFSFALLPLWSCARGQADLPYVGSNKLGKNTMAWTTPTLVEICIGLEINGYLPAEF